jgi:hypothetical protein
VYKLAALAVSVALLLISNNVGPKRTCPIPRYGPVAVALIHVGRRQETRLRYRISPERRRSFQDSKTDLACEEISYHFSLCFHVTRITQPCDSEICFWPNENASNCCHVFC